MSKLPLTTRICNHLPRHYAMGRTERQIAQYFKLQRETVRKALRDLWMNGIIDYESTGYTLKYGLQLGDKVKLTNPKSVAIWEAIEARPYGQIIDLDPYHFRGVVVTAEDTPERIRMDTFPIGYRVAIVDMPMIPPIHYRQSELQKVDRIPTKEEYFGAQSQRG